MHDKRLKILFITSVAVLLIGFWVNLTYKLPSSYEYMPKGYVSKYDDFIDDVCKMKKSYKLNKTDGTPKEMFNELWECHPEIFWTSDHYMYMDMGSYYDIDISYTGPKLLIAIQRIILNWKANSIANQAMKETEDRERLRYIHDALTSRTSYVYGISLFWMVKST